MDFFEFICDLISDIKIWVGIGIGFLFAIIGWHFLPETVDRLSMGVWVVGIGFVGGLIFAKTEK